MANKKANRKEVFNIETTIELYSSAGALDKFARVQGLYKDSMQLEIEGKVRCATNGSRHGR